MRILCLLAHSFESQMPTTTKRIIPFMRKLKEKRHKVDLQENLAMRDASPREYKYLPARLRYLVRLTSHVSPAYDLVFASKPETSVLAYTLSKKLSIPYILDLDDLERISALDIFGYATELLIRKASRIFVSSMELYKLYRRIRGDVVYLPNSVDLEYFNPERYKDIDKMGELTFLWVSGIEDWFDLCTLILTSFSKLEEGRILIIGKVSNSQKRYCEKLVRNLRLEKRVTLKGWVSDNEVPLVYRSSDIALLPFKDTPWARCKCPSRLFEFMAMELPFICTVGEPAYIVKKVGCGLIAKPKPEDFAEKMKNGVDYLDKLRKKAKQGRKYLLREQNFDVLVEKLERILLRIIE